MVINEKERMMNKAVTFLLAAMVFSLAGHVSAEAPVSRCQAYSLDIGLGLARAGFQAAATCSATPTTNEAEFLFSLVLADGQHAVMICNPTQCNVPVIVTTK